MLDYSEYGIDGINESGTTEQRAACPMCPTMKPYKKKGSENSKDLAVNIDKKTWHCFRCGWSGGLSQDKFNHKPTYNNIETGVPDDPNQAVYDYFFKRGITKEVVIRNKIGLAKEVFIPQTGKKENCIAFNYYIGNSLVNIKYRTKSKNFLQVSKDKGATKCLYKLNDIVNETECIITEGECFTDDAEIMTRDGFVPFSLYYGQDVLQIDNELIGSFIRPTAVIRNNVTNIRTIETKSKSHYMRTTQNHNYVTIKNGNINKIKALDAFHYRGQIKIPCTLNKLNNIGVDLTDDEIRFCIAVSADVTIRKSGDVYCGFKKERKIIRYENLLNRLKIPYKKSHNKNGYTSFFIRRGYNPGYLFKIFPKNWLGLLNDHQVKLIIEELLYWDGNTLPNRDQIEYSTKEYENAKFIQTISHLAGFKSTIVRRSNQFGKWFKISILFSKHDYDTAPANRRFVNYTGVTYCVQVPTGMILVRQKEKIYISGNCDTLAFEVAGHKNAVSVPDGGIQPETKNIQTKMDFLDNSAPFLENIKKYYLALDSDAPGVKMRDELARRLGKAKCWIINFPEGCKDANDVLITYGTKHLSLLIENAEPYPYEGIIYAKDCKTELMEIFKNGYPVGPLTNFWKKFDSLLKHHASNFIVLTGIPGHGKSTWLDNWLAYQSVINGSKFGVFSPENKILASHVKKYLQIMTGKNFEIKRNQMTETELDKALDFVNSHIYNIRPPTSEFQIDDIYGAAEHLVFKHGITSLVIDNWSSLGHLKKPGDTPDDYHSRIFNEISFNSSKLGINTILVAHPTKLKKKDYKKDNKYGGNSNKLDYEIPLLGDISGSNKFFTSADIGISVYRNFKDDGFDSTTTVYITKIREDFYGKLGYVTYSFNEQSRRFTELGTEAPLGSLIDYEPPPVYQYEDPPGEAIENKDPDYVPF